MPVAALEKFSEAGEGATRGGPQGAGVDALEGVGTAASATYGLGAVEPVGGRELAAFWSCGSASDPRANTNNQ
jgi:hypothetical protein